jgi:TonB family protein
MSKLSLVVAVALLSSHFAHGQGPNDGFVMEGEGNRHLLVHAEPIYPPIAKAAHVQGSVLLHVYVDEAGAVTKVEDIGGPPMLKSAAIDAVKKWTYKPFEVNGRAVSVKVIVSVPFSLGIPDSVEKNDNAIGQAYFPKADECRAANAKGQWTQAVVLCGDLVTIADRFPDPSTRMNEIRVAHQDYGEALAFSGDLSKALEQFHRTTELAEGSLSSKDAEYGTAYYWQAFGEHASKMLVEAERDYNKAEDSYRKAMANLSDMKQIYGRYLAHTLAYHSILALQMGRSDQAKKMQDEALQLDPKALDGMKGNGNE